MNKKGFEAVNLKETPNLNEVADKPFKTKEIQNKRVDINILKARAKAIQDKENVKNMIILKYHVFNYIIINFLIYLIIIKKLNY